MVSEHLGKPDKNRRIDSGTKPILLLQSFDDKYISPNGIGLQALRLSMLLDLA